MVLYSSHHDLLLPHSGHSKGGFVHNNVWSSFLGNSLFSSFVPPLLLVYPHYPEQTHHASSLPASPHDPLPPADDPPQHPPLLALLSAPGPASVPVTYVE